MTQARVVLFSGGRTLALLGITLLVGACSLLDNVPESAKATANPPQPIPAPAAAATPGTPPQQPYEQAVLSAATALFRNAKLPAEGTSPLPRYPVVIDPLIDGVTGIQSVATQSMGAQLANMMKTQYPNFEHKEFSAANIAGNPLVLIGTFTGVNAERKTSGPREAYRICLALADLRSGKLVSKGLAFATPEGIDPTPLTFFRDAPAWSEDPATEGYIKTCQGTKAGDPINPLYLDRILTASLIAAAIEAYDEGRYRDALENYSSAERMPGGKQLRVLNGLYLSQSKLGRTKEAEAAFARLVDFGLEKKSLAIKFLFRPGSTAFVSDPKLSGPYPVWLKNIATRTANTNNCLEVTGHSSPTGPEPLNERLSQLRADYIKTRLESAAPSLSKRLISAGMGSKKTLIGNRRDDASDALDRRVEFRVIGC